MLQYNLFRAVLFSLTCLFFVSAFLPACNSSSDEKSAGQPDESLTEEQRRLPENALKGLIVARGLTVKPVATEPLLKNPTNIDVDERGRIWVTEAYNYRPEINGNPVNPKGDRIMIIEDNDGDGKADTAKVFYQGSEIDAPLGICVLGNRVLVSQSPYVWEFFDDNGDDKADRKEIFFQGMGGIQHDHGMHTFIFGPDGKLYFNFGNEGKTLKDKQGRVVRDQDGDEIGPKKYKQGMVFRCNPDGTQVECLGENFRNNYELAVDSYGGIWQSDNDDDGNQGVRINYVMDYGNYGYQDEMTGASWSATRTNMEDSIRERHWHLNDPGVVPNLLQTGAGSPTGMVMYEGAMLPEVFHNEMIHADAGTNVIRSYPVEKNGAGYKAGIENILNGNKDQWFRPSDLCVAPDGSLIIADWYDPGVGGHQAGDQQKGRLYRVAPEGSRYQFEKQDFTTAEGALKALRNPNIAVRYHAWTALQTMGPAAVPVLEKEWRSANNPRMRARAFWVLAKMRGGEKYITEAVSDSLAEIRMMGIRAARQLNSNVPEVVRQLVKDRDPQVRRECAIALRHRQSPGSAELWAILASQHDGKDRWYLEALGIGADGQWDAFFPAYLKQVPDPLASPAGRDIVWRARTEAAVPYLAKLAADESVDLKSRLRYFRAFDFNAGPSKSPVLLSMINTNNASNAELNKLILRHLDEKTVKRSATAQKALSSVLAAVSGTPEYVELVRRYNYYEAKPQLAELAIAHDGKQLGRDAAGLLLNLNGQDLVLKVLSGQDEAKAKAMILSLGRVGAKNSMDIVQKVMMSDKYSDALRSVAATAIGHSESGADHVLELLAAKKVPADLIPSAVEGVKGSWRKAVYLKAASFLPGGGEAITKKEVPDIKQVLTFEPDAGSGGVIFNKLCTICHQAGSEGQNVGPNLSYIGDKLPKEALYEAIVNPSAGISFGYETWQLEMKDGTTVTGIMASKTEQNVQIKQPGGASQTIMADQIKKRTQLKESLMPAFGQTLSAQEQADLLEYLSSLKKK